MSNSFVITPGEAPGLMPELHMLALVSGEYTEVSGITSNGELVSLEHAPLGAWNELAVFVGRDSTDPKDIWLNNIMVQRPLNPAQLEKALQQNLSLTVPHATDLREVEDALQARSYKPHYGEVWMGLPHANDGGDSARPAAEDITVVRISRRAVTYDGKNMPRLSSKRELGRLCLPTLEGAYSDGVSDTNPYGVLSSEAVADVEKAWHKQGEHYWLHAHVILARRGGNAFPVAVAVTRALTDPESKVARISSVGTLPEERHKGYGTAVVRAAIQSARSGLANEARYPVLHTISNAYPYKFYEKIFQFVPIIVTRSFQRPESIQL
jgi:GNAT superfamily N-acetyltransferase